MAYSNKQASKNTLIAKIDNHSKKAAGFPFMVNKSSWSSIHRPNLPLTRWNTGGRTTMNFFPIGQRRN